MAAVSVNIGDRAHTTAVSGAATANHTEVVVTTDSLSTAAGGTYTLTLTNGVVYSDSCPVASVWFGTCTTGTPVVTSVTPTFGYVTVVIQNIHASDAFNGTLVIGVVVL